jgi:DNA-binding response OmpR family regulator
MENNEGISIVKTSSMKKRILVADDDPGIRDILKIIFERAGYEIELKEDGSDIFTNNYTIPDLFLLDKQLPGKDGLTICRFLKSQAATKHIPVLIISASTDFGREARNAGADDYIEKPFDLNHLLVFVEQFINPGKVLHNA